MNKVTSKQQMKNFNDMRTKFGYNVLGEMLAKQGGKKWSTLMKQRN